jgi:hypothetical protein
MRLRISECAAEFTGVIAQRVQPGGGLLQRVSELAAQL